MEKFKIGDEVKYERGDLTYTVVGVGAINITIKNARGGVYTTHHSKLTLVNNNNNMNTLSKIEQMEADAFFKNRRNRKDVLEINEGVTKWGDSLNEAGEKIGKLYIKINTFKKAFNTAVEQGRVSDIERMMEEAIEIADYLNTLQDSPIHSLFSKEDGKKSFNVKEFFNL